MDTIFITGKLADIENERFYDAEIMISKGRITSVKEIAGSTAADTFYILPGFIDSHVHIESSMLVPSEFARMAVVHGTVATISDPHEIANVCGMPGVDYMIDNGKTVPFKFNFGAPSCVPATSFETAGASLNAEDVKKLLQRDDIKYLSEMMNFPGVLNHDDEVIKKISAAHELNKPVDGHAPGLTGDTAKKYIAAGISTDHECFTREEALYKLQQGMKVLIREGSAAKNFEALIGLLHDYPDRIMFCSDDKHPDSLAIGHINQLCARAVIKGVDIFKILKAACVNPVLHYKLDVGLLKEGDPADLIIVKDLRNFEVKQTYINGELVAENGRSLIKSSQAGVLNNFSCTEKKPADFSVTATDHTKATPVIEALDGQLITNKLFEKLPVNDNRILPDIKKDILKIAVVNRYYDTVIAKAFIKNFGFTKGAIASSVAHDSHNIVSVGTDDKSICEAVNLVIKEKGGVSAVYENQQMILPLPVAGLMSHKDGYEIAAAYTAIDKMTKEVMGSTLNSPFMTLSFMALLVIPHLKLSDKGLFDGDTFTFIP